jgi:hypothetical protein
MPECSQVGVTVQVCILKIFHNDRLKGYHTDNGFSFSIETLEKDFHRRKPLSKSNT